MREIRAAVPGSFSLAGRERKGWAPRLPARWAVRDACCELRGPDLGEFGRLSATIVLSDRPAPDFPPGFFGELFLAIYRALLRLAYIYQPRTILLQATKSRCNRLIFGGLPCCRMISFCPFHPSIRLIICYRAIRAKLWRSHANHFVNQTEQRVICLLNTLSPQYANIAENGRLLKWLRGIWARKLKVWLRLCSNVSHLIGNLLRIMADFCG